MCQNSYSQQKEQMSRKDENATFISAHSFIYFKSAGQFPGSMDMKLEGNGCF